jgi:predicted kinase
MPRLYIFAGLPGTGKTTLAQQLAARISAVYLRIDTIEQGLRDLCGVRVEAEGYRLAYRIAAENLRLGLDVVSDSCNPLELTRREWEQVAKNNSAEFVNIEVICSNQTEHQHRVESRRSDIPELRLPTWRDVQDREYHQWSADRIIIDTAECSTDESLAALKTMLGGMR